MIPMTSPTYRVVAMRETTQKTVEMLYEGELVRLAIDLTPMGRTSSGLYATDCRLEKQMIHLPLGKPRGLSGGCFGARKYRQGHEGGLMS